MDFSWIKGYWFWRVDLLVNLLLTFRWGNRIVRIKQPTAISRERHHDALLNLYSMVNGIRWDHLWPSCRRQSRLSESSFFRFWNASKIWLFFIKVYIKRIGFQLDRRILVLKGRFASKSLLKFRWGDRIVRIISPTAISYEKSHDPLLNLS